MENMLELQLIDFWKNTLSCKRCNLPENCVPQFRPVGQAYDKRRIVFVQINPAHVGRLTDEEINAKYKRANSRKIAFEKQVATEKIVSLQKTFMESSTIKNWVNLNEGYRNVISNIWGWPPGKYIKTIKRHGVVLEEIAIVNLVQCPVPKDRHTNRYLQDCWHQNTMRLFKILRPKIIVAQSDQIFKFLLSQDCGEDVILVKGVHHASRKSNEAKERVFSDVKAIIEQFRS